MRQEIDVDNVLDELTRASAIITEFIAFLRRRERKHLFAQETEFVQNAQKLISFSRRLPLGQIEKRYSEEVKPFLKNAATEWVKLMQEASDVRVAVRQLRALVKAANADKQKVNAVSGMYRFGEWIELIMSGEADINYRIVERLEKCLNRAKRQALRTDDTESSTQIEELQNLRKTRKNGFESPRGSITHAANFAQTDLVKGRIWELVCIHENPSSPSEVLIRTIEENVDGYITLIYSEAMQTAELLIDFYPKLRTLLNRQFSV